MSVDLRWFREWAYWAHRRIKCGMCMVAFRPEQTVDASYCLDRHMPYHLGDQ